MSVINQVLNQLEQRGAHTAPEQTMVRVVPPARRNLMMPLLILVLVLAGGAAAWQWLQARQSKPAVVSAAQPVRKTPPPAAASAVQPVPVVAAAASAVVASEPQPAETFPPVSRLSFELSSIPLPSSLRGLKNGEGSEREEVASPATPAHQAKAHTISPAPQEPRAIRLPDGVAQMKQVSPAQRADAEFRKAVALMQQGHIADAIAGYEAVLRMDAGHDAARQALVALLLEGKRGLEAERVLQEGLKARPEHTGFAMLLARLQVEQGATGQAIVTLERSLPYADSLADYQAFFAALLQRQDRHKEALTHYQIALQLAPGNGVWLVGYGISLQAVQRSEEARDMFRRALESGMLSAELQAFAQRKLRELDGRQGMGPSGQAGSLPPPTR